MNPKEPEVKLVVHVLHHGRVLCGFSDKVPGEWPPGHRWISIIDEWAHLNCEECRKRVREFARDA